MKLAVDTDAFCKLGIANLLKPTASALGIPIADWVRLPALPYMLERGQLRARFGAKKCDALLPVARSVGALGRVDGDLLEKLVTLSDVDPGEALILGAAAAPNVKVLTHDKRALRAVANVPDVATELSGRVIVLEAVLLSLCESFGDGFVATAVEPLHDFDTMVKVCFSGKSTPKEGLASYYNTLADEVRPLALWKHEMESEG